MKTKHYVITAVVAYLLFLITTLPASTVTGLVNDSLPQVTIQGVSGTLWNGTAQRITVAPNHVIDDVNWSICSWRLLIGEVCVDLDSTYLNHSLQGQIGIGVTGNLSAQNLKTSMSAKALGQLAGLPLGELSGLVDINLDSLNWTRGEVPSATGSAFWKDASITVAETAFLGNITLTFEEGDTSPLIARISNKNGDIQVSGNININDDASYALELQLTPNNTASDNLISSLSMFSKKQSNGSFVFSNTGNLKQFGIM